MAGINFDLLGDNAFEAYQKFQNADTQKQLAQQQLAQSQQTTRLGAAQEAALQAKAKHEKTLNAISQVVNFRTLADAQKDLETKRASGELDEPTYTRVKATLPKNDSEMPTWAYKTIQSLLPVADQYAAMKDEQAQAQLRERFHIGPAPEPASVSGVNNLAPSAPVTSDINALNTKTLAPVEVKNRAPVMPTEEEAAYMSSSSHKPTAEAGQRVLAYYNAQPELLKLQTRANQLRVMIAKEGGDPNTDPEIQAINARIKQLSTHTPPVTINTGQQLEKAEHVKKGEFNVGEYADIAKANSANTKLLPALDVSERILNKGFETGFGTDTKVAGAKVLSLFGVPDATKYASDAATFKAMLAQTVLQRQLEQKGVATEGDAARIEDTYAKASNPVDANKFILATARATIQRDQEHKKFYDAWWAKNKTYEGASTAWDEGPANKSIFTYPALKAYAPKTTAPSAPVKALPKPGDIRDGYVYKGGDPGSQTSWEKAGK